MRDTELSFDGYELRISANITNSKSERAYEQKSSIVILLVILVGVPLIVYNNFFRKKGDAYYNERILPLDFHSLIVRKNENDHARNGSPSITVLDQKNDNLGFAFTVWEQTGVFDSLRLKIHFSKKGEN
jgi:hypothetical protein